MDWEKVKESTLTGPIADSPIIAGAVVNSVTPYGLIWTPCP